MDSLSLRESLDIADNPAAHRKKRPGPAMRARLLVENREGKARRASNSSHRGLKQSAPSPTRRHKLAAGIDERVSEPQAVLENLGALRELPGGIVNPALETTGEDKAAVTCLVILRTL